MTGRGAHAGGGSPTRRATRNSSLRRCALAGLAQRQKGAPAAAAAAALGLSVPEPNRSVDGARGHLPVSKAAVPRPLLSAAVTQRMWLWPVWLLLQPYCWLQYLLRAWADTAARVRRTRAGDGTAHLACETGERRRWGIWSCACVARCGNLKFKLWELGTYIVSLIDVI